MFGFLEFLRKSRSRRVDHQTSIADIMQSNTRKDYHKEYHPKRDWCR